MMSKYRSILALALAFVFTLLITFTDSAAAATKSRTKAPTYSAVQTEQIQGYANEVGALRDRLTELQDLIQNEKWTFARNFIHGPLGELRTKMLSAAKVLAPEPQKQAREASKEVFTALVGIDQAGADRNYKTAIRNYGLLLKGLDTFFKALPVGPQPPAPAKFTVPEIKTPKIEMPKIEMPKIEMPKIEMPKIEMPKIELPKAAEPTAPSDSEMAAPASSEMMTP